VTARNQFQSQFAFSEAGFAGDQYADTQYVHEDAVHRDALCKFFRQIHAQIVDDLCGRQRRRKQRNVLGVADRHDAGWRFQALRNDDGGRLTGDQFGRVIRTRTGRQTFVVFGFLMAEYLDAAGVDQVQVADLVSRRGGIAGDQPFAAGKSRKPSELQRFAIVVIQLLDRERSR
jgi:hypothetical protein